MTLRLLAACTILSLATPAAARPPTGGPQEIGAQLEEAYPVVVLDNGGFTDPVGAADSPVAGRIPWWKGPVSARAIKSQADIRWLKLDELGLYAEQSIPVYGPLVNGVIVRGLVRGHYPNLTIIDGRGDEAVVELERQLEPKAFINRPEPVSFEVRLSEVSKALGRSLEPRITLRLGPIMTVREPGGFERPDKVYWTNLEVLAPMPLPTREALRAEILVRLDRIFSNWFERGLDRTGSRETGFVGQSFDVITGEALGPVQGGWLFLWEHLLFALEAEPDPEWRAAFDAFCSDYFELGIHPDTGLPRKWDCALDQPLDDQVVDVHADLRFMLDLVEHGPEDWRERALAAARRVGEAVLAKGVLPDGSVAPHYKPADGSYDLSAPHIRALNLPAQLGRLGALTGDARFTDAARGALAELEFTHRWGGSWDRIDPDFDDNFGNFGEASITLLQSHPGDAVFGRLAESGWEHFAPLWRDAVRHGGSMAADQVRCWALLADLSRLRPALRDELVPLLGEAARAHIKGQQYDGGAWGDVTHMAHGPRPGLGVGDFSGAPANLLRGLALLHEQDLELPERSVRALFTAVMRSTFATYGRPYGVLQTREQLTGANICGADLRLCGGLVAMLHTLGE